jgi:hypothetical protein
MNVAIDTAIAMNQGLTVGLEAIGLGPAVAALIDAASRVETVLR